MAVAVIVAAAAAVVVDTAAVAVETEDPGRADQETDAINFFR